MHESRVIFSCIPLLFVAVVVVVSSSSSPSSSSPSVVVVDVVVVVVERFGKRGRKVTDIPSVFAICRNTTALLVAGAQQAQEAVRMAPVVPPGGLRV